MQGFECCCLVIVEAGAEGVELVSELLQLLLLLLPLLHFILMLPLQLTVLSPKLYARRISAHRCIALPLCATRPRRMVANAAFGEHKSALQTP